MWNNFVGKKGNTFGLVEVGEKDEKKKKKDSVPGIPDDGIHKEGDKLENLAEGIT